MTTHNATLLNTHSYWPQLTMTTNPQKEWCSTLGIETQVLNSCSIRHEGQQRTNKCLIAMETSPNAYSTNRSFK